MSRQPRRAGSRALSRQTLLLAVLAVAVAAGRGDAQVVRGHVTARATGAPLAGVLVALERAGPGDSTVTSVVVRAVLSRTDGSYAIAVPQPGTYRVTAKRIGAQRFDSPPFDVGTGETRQLDIVLDAAAAMLPEVRVVEMALCVRDPREVGRANALWDEARTALEATRISLRDRLFQARVVRYIRELDPRSLRVLSESRSGVSGIVDRPVSGPSADSLSVAGFWQAEGDGTVAFYAPDADILLSDAFRRDHCFHLAAARRDRRGLVGLAFDPDSGRVVPDVTGTLWLDAQSFVLRFVEFTYTQLEDSRDSRHVGGELHFEPLPGGAWILRRWFIRMPRSGRAVIAPLGVQANRPTVLIRPAGYRLVEEGGEVLAEERRPGS